mmetsp:Transcript_40943/g.102960  ORF Transcript_40943/g.102960 Transcript_40943/m.102960 type:complete len:204 (-) Transcript_40943:120-731(-)
MLIHDAGEERTAACDAQTREERREAAPPQHRFHPRLRVGRARGRRAAPAATPAAGLGERFPVQQRLRCRSHLHEARCRLGRRVSIRVESHSVVAERRFHVLPGRGALQAQHIIGAPAAAIHHAAAVEGDRFSAFGGRALARCWRRSYWRRRIAAAVGNTYKNDAILKYFCGLSPTQLSAWRRPANGADRRTVPRARGAPGGLL